MRGGTPAPGRPVRPSAALRGRRATTFGLVAAALLTALPACSDSPSALDPAGPRADEISTLWWVMLGIGTVVWLIVLGLLLWAVLRRRRSEALEARRAVSEPEKLVLIGGAVVPAVILIGLLFYIMSTLHDVSKA